MPSEYKTSTGERLMPEWMRRVPAVAWLVPLALLYLSLYQRYRAYEIDNPWFLSFSREYWINHFQGDFFQGDVFPLGMGGTVVFGRTAALVQAALLNIIGWRPLPATIMSSALVLAGLYFWLKFLEESGLSSLQRGALILVLGMTEPFVGMAERFRYEPFSFLLMASAFWLAQIRRPMLALLVAIAAAEIHPASSIIFVSLLLFLSRSGIEPKHLLYKALCAVFCFVLLYRLIHPDILDVLRMTDWRIVGESKPLGGFVRAYFIDRRRHLPELILIALAIMYYVKHRACACPFVNRMAELTLCVCVFSALVGWPTSAYMIFFYPFAGIVALWSLEKVNTTALKPTPLLLVLIASVLILPQYAALAWINRNDGFSERDLLNVKRSIQAAEQQLNLDDRTAQIMGDYSLWYAHPDRYRAVSTKTEKYVSREDLFLCFDQPLRPKIMVDPTVLYCGSIYQRRAVREIDTLVLRGHTLHILAPMQNGS